MPVKKQRLAKFALVGMLLVFFTACSSTKTIPMVIQSDPLGADVIYQVRSQQDNQAGDWIYLGKTPIEVNRRHRNAELKKSHSFVFRAFKEGYLDQTKEWRGKDIEDEEDEKGYVFWNPRLVPTE